MLGFRALVGGVAGGVIGVILWTSVTYFTGYEIGWVAWFVGVLTGLGVSAATEKRGRFLIGALAAIIAVGAIGAGKITLARLAASQAIADVGANFTDDDAIYHMAESDPAVNPDDDDTIDPAAIDRATARWGKMSETERDAYRMQASHEVRQRMEQDADSVTAVALIASLTPFDLIWMGLAALSSFKIAGRSRHPRHSTFIQSVANKEGGLHPVFKGSSEADSMNPASFGGIRGLPSSPSGATPRFAPGAQAAAPPGADQDQAPRAHASDNEAA